MKCQILSIGMKMPKWCTLACEEYLTRLSRLMKCTLIEIPIAMRHKATPTHIFKEEEGRKILQKISPDDNVIALDVKGQSWSTLHLYDKLSYWKQEGRDLIFVIGGPDGLSEACLTRADNRWSLSALTFPHALVRVLLLEQLYRAASMHINHPYHRE